MKLQRAPILRLSISVSIASTFVAGLCAYAAPFKSDDTVVSRNGISTGDLYEYSANGVLQQHLSVPYPGTDMFEIGEMRDLAFDNAGRLHIYHGTFAPSLSTLNPATGTWSQHTASGWSTVNVTDYGGLSTYRNFVYVTDTATAGGEANGIVRFDTTNFSSQRFFDGTDFFDVATGLDGLLYASPDTTHVNVYDPLTMALLRTISLPVEISGIAVAHDGTIFAPERFATKIHRFNANGVEEASIDTGDNYLQDIDLSATGKLVVGSRFGKVYESDTSLSGFSVFQTATTDPIFVAFVPIPEPSTWVVVLLGLVPLVCMLQAASRPRMAVPGRAPME